MTRSPLQQRARLPRLAAAVALVAAALVLGAPAKDAGDDVYNPPDPEPTAEETLLLEYVNRFRADPAAEAKRVRDNPGSHGAGRTVDWDLFAKEMKALAPAPPLVMNLKLLLAARRHAHYLTVNEKRGHEEDGANEGFTGIKMPQRVTQAGYIWTAWYENIYVAFDPWSVHAGFVVDYAKGTPDGMRKGRGHRVNMLHPETREAGTAAYERSRDRLYTEGFANRKGVARFVGGVVYVDRDGDGFYSVGEGVGGVKVTASDGASATTWKSGGYALELPDTEALTVTFTDAAGKTWQAKVPAGADNAKVDWKRKP